MPATATRPETSVLGTGLWRFFGAALFALGLLVPSYTVWSIGSLADDMALEIGVPNDYKLTELRTTNFGFRSEHLATALIQGSGEDRSSLRSYLRNRGFTAHRADPEQWIRPRSGAYDATIWQISQVDPAASDSRGADLAIRATTVDDDLLDLLPLAIVVGLLLQVGGITSSLKRRLSARHAVAIGILTLSTLVLSATLRALIQGRELIDAHQSAHGPLSTNDMDLAALSTEGTAAEQLLSLRLGTVEGLYPFGFLIVLATAALTGIGVFALVGTSRARTTALGLLAAGCIASIAIFGESSGLIIDILE